jgi:TolB protein
MAAVRSLAASLVGLAAVVLGCAAPASGSLPATQLLPLADSLGGKILFVKDGNIWVWTDGRARQMTTGETWRQPQWSPDGTEIAYVYRATNFSEIFVMNADGTNNRRLTNGQSSALSDNDWVFRPTWSPNGAQIAYVSDSETYNPVVWLMSRDGSSKKQLLNVTDFQEAADALSWSPDGKRLAITAFGHELSQITLVELSRPAAQPATANPNGALDPAWSSDGAILAYAVRESARMDIRLRRLDGSPEVEVSRGGLARAPAWSPDGRHLSYISSRGGTFELYAVDVGGDGGQPTIGNERQLTHDLNVDAASGLSWGK